jgi:LPXTG-site transpeptidase (sortase) family protein
MPSIRKRASRHKKVFRIKKSFLRIHRIKIGILLVVLGVAFLMFPTTYKNVVQMTKHQVRSSVLTSTATSSAGFSIGSIHIDKNLLKGHETPQAPLRIVIPKLTMDLPVVEANVVDGYWELSDTSASHGVGSASPGEMGNTVIFAHARDGLFGPLRSITIGDMVYILTKDRWVRYLVTGTTLVDEGQTEVIAPTADETLTLYTCSGFLDSKRLIVTAKPQRP